MSGEITRQELMDAMDAPLASLIESLAVLQQNSGYIATEDLTTEQLATRMAWHYAHVMAKRLSDLMGGESIKTDEQSIAADLLHMHEAMSTQFRFGLRDKGIEGEVANSIRYYFPETTEERVQQVVRDIMSTRIEY